MANDKYVLGKRSGSKQIVFHSYEYNGHTIVYRASVPYKEGAPKSYYVGLVDKKMNQLKAKGKLKKYNEAYIRKMVWLTRRKKVAIGIGVGALAVIGIAVGVTVSLVSYYQPANVTFASKTLSIDHTNVTLHKDANFTFTVNEFYANYGYSLPDTIDQVTINGVDLTPDQYKYSNGHLNIGASYVTGKVFIAAEAKAVDFATDSWENVIRYANSGLNELHIRYGTDSLIGYEHPIQVNNADFNVRVIGEGHDRLVDKLDQAGTLTLEFETPVISSSFNDISSTCDQIYEKLPTSIKSAVKSVYKSSFDGSEVSFGSWKVFPLSYREINGYETYEVEEDAVYSGEESCYEYYHDLDVVSLKAKRKKNSNYWLRDVDARNPDGNAVSINSSDGSTTRRQKESPLGIAPAFAIGKTKSLITDEWENVALYSNYGLDALKEHYGRNSFIGLERNLEFNDGTVHRVRVVGEDHDALRGSKNKVAALTFEFITPIEDTHQYGELATTTSYSTSTIRDELAEIFNTQFPQVLVNNIPYVSKKSVEYKLLQEGDVTWEVPSCETTDEKLFLLSLREVGDNYFGTAEPYSLEEEPYQYYQVSGDLEAKELENLINKKRLKDGNNYWLRSHYCMRDPKTKTLKAHIVDNKGRTFGVNGSTVTTITHDVNEVYYCYPAFSLGYSNRPVGFANDTWENVTYHAGLGLDHLREYYHTNSFIGYEREITLSNGEEPTNYIVRVIGENEDKTIDDGLAALTFEFKTGITPAEGVRYFDSESFPNYTNSVIRNYCNETVLSYLPEVVQDSIKTVKKKTAALNIVDDVYTPYIEETEDKVFVLSYNEIENHDPEIDLPIYADENSTYSYYDGAKNMVRYKTSNDLHGNYWLRTPFVDYSGSSYIISYCVNKYGTVSQSKPTVALAVAPAFCI